MENSCKLQNQGCNLPSVEINFACWTFFLPMQFVKNVINKFKMIILTLNRMFKIKYLILNYDIYRVRKQYK